MPDAAFPFLPDPHLRLTGNSVRDARRLVGDRAGEHQAHWQSLVDRGLIGRARSPEEEVARAAAEASARALDRVFGKDRDPVW